MGVNTKKQKNKEKLQETAENIQKTSNNVNKHINTNKHTQTGMRTRAEMRYKKKMQWGIPRIAWNAVILGGPLSFHPHSCQAKGVRARVTSPGPVFKKGRVKRLLTARILADPGLWFDRILHGRGVIVSLWVSVFMSSLDSRGI